jgi:hypothetical protein
VFSCYPDILFASALGSYGIGFVLVAIASGLALMRMRGMAVSAAIMGRVLALLMYAPNQSDRPKENDKALAVGGVPAEFPVELEVPRLLDAALKATRSGEAVSVEASRRLLSACNTVVGLRTCSLLEASGQMFAFLPVDGTDAIQDEPPVFTIPFGESFKRRQS